MVLRNISGQVALFISIALIALTCACVKGPPQKNAPKKAAKAGSTVAEKVDTIEVTRSVKPAAPAFKEVLAKSPKSEIKILSLKQIFARPNSPKDLESWFLNNEFQRPLCNLSESQNSCSPKIPKEFQGLILLNALPFSKGYFLIYGSKGDEGHLVLITDEDVKKADYAIDFSDFAKLPKDMTNKDSPLLLSINYLKLENDTLYVSYGHKKTAKESLGNNSFLTALKLPDGKALWHSRPLVANSFNFAPMGDYLITGYGNTGEPDFLFLINKHTGAITQLLSLVTGPEYIIQRGNEVYVRTYNTNYIFEIERQ